MRSATCSRRSSACAAACAYSTINKSYLHSVLNSMTDAVFVTSPDGVIKMANSAACKLLGYTEEELLGRSILAVLDEREREDFDLLQAAQETRETVVRTRTGQTIPVSLHRLAHRQRRPAVPGQHLRRAQHHRSQARRAPHPLPRPLRRADQDPQPHAVPSRAAADHRAQRAQRPGGGGCCIWTWTASRRSTTPSATAPVTACSRCWPSA